MRSPLPSLEELLAAEAAHDPDRCDDPTCRDVPAGSEWFGMGMSFGSDGRVRFHHETHSRHLRSVTRARRWREQCSAYETDPDDFVLAYNWLQHHPVFHQLRFRHDQPPAPDMSCEELDAAEAAAHRLDSCGLRGMSMHVFHGQDDRARVVLEHGPYLWPSNFTQTPQRAPEGCWSSDPSLTVSAATYEDAIVSLAKAVHAEYGNSRDRIADTRR